jgi:hypothetical protein
MRFVDCSNPFFGQQQRIIARAGGEFTAPADRSPSRLWRPHQLSPDWFRLSGHPADQA